MEDQLPGMRFYPTEEELVSFYLHNKLQGTRPDIERVIPVVDIYQFDPWQLPQKAAGEDRHRYPEEWFFFTPRQEREARGGRTNRITTSGFWKATGCPGWVYSSNNRVIAEKKTMVFYTGKAPTGTKTKWKMNEFRAINEGEASTSSGATPKLLHEFSLCRVYVKSRNSQAFDRRPIGAMAKDTQIHQPRRDVAGYSHDQNSQIMVEKKLISSDSSSSGDQIHPTKTGGENTNLEMSDDVDHLWEWEEQFDLP